jgi:hypothetical protein
MIAILIRMIVLLAAWIFSLNSLASSGTISAIYTGGAAESSFSNLPRRAYYLASA